ncbi:MAG: hypothetical protein ACE5JL_13850 [Dehalococcoidia bacterium]
MKTTDLMLFAATDISSGTAVIPAHVIGSMQTGHIPVEVFNESEGGEEAEASLTSEGPPADEPMFGTHIREAIEVLRRRR